MVKICPILNINRTDKTETCKQEECEWWIETAQCCAIFMIAGEALRANSSK